MNSAEKIIEIINTGGYNCLEEFLKENGISGRLMRRLIKGKHLLINGRPADNDSKIGVMDTISIILEDEVCDVEPQNIELEIIYEDRDVLVLNKKPFIVVHPTKNIVEGTLSNGVSAYFQKIGLKRKIRLVNRLDRDTSGVIVYAKNSYAHQYLARQMENGSMKKRYMAVVKGNIKESTGTIDSPIGLSDDGIRQVVRSDGAPSKTVYKLIQVLKNASVLEVELLTGRTHQIRVHLASIGNPIIGDTLYGSSIDLINRQALHAVHLEFLSPETMKIVEVEAPIPDDLTRLINTLI